MGRYWGFWTRGKLDLLRRYLDAFTTASKGQREIIYLDLFGGQPHNRDRLTDENLDGSARIALGTADARFTRLRFFEIEPYASRLRTALVPDYPDRDFRVISGDCNQTVTGALRELAPYDWAPTFALVDPNGPDVHWSTVEALAGFKKPHLTKVELWVLLAAGMFIRTLPRDGRVRPEDAAKLTQMYGTEQWRAIYEARVGVRLSPADAREEYVNLMRWRLQHVLRYQRTHPLEIFNERGNPIYHMIFRHRSSCWRSDHDRSVQRRSRRVPAHATGRSTTQGAAGRAGSRRPEPLRRRHGCGYCAATPAGASLHPLRTVVALRHK